MKNVQLTAIQQVYDFRIMKKSPRRFLYLCHVSDECDCWFRIQYDVFITRNL